MRHSLFANTTTTEIYTLSLHDALPICPRAEPRTDAGRHSRPGPDGARGALRSEEHTSELQSQFQLVWRLLLEKKKARKSRWERSCDIRSSPVSILYIIYPQVTR